MTNLTINQLVYIVEAGADALLRCTAKRSVVPDSLRKFVLASLRQDSSKNVGVGQALVDQLMADGKVPSREDAIGMIIASVTIELCIPFLDPTLPELQPKPKRARAPKATKKSRTV